MRIVNRCGLHIRYETLQDPSGLTWLFTYYTDTTSDSGRWNARVTYPCGKVKKYTTVPYVNIKLMIWSITKVGCVSYKEVNNYCILDAVVRNTDKLTYKEFRAQYECSPTFALNVFREIERCRKREGITGEMPESLGSTLSLLTIRINTLCRATANANRTSLLMKRMRLSASATTHGMGERR